MVSLGSRKQVVESGKMFVAGSILWYISGGGLGNRAGLWVLSEKTCLARLGSLGLLRLWGGGWVFSEIQVRPWARLGRAGIYR